jgi:hypothetical protein
MPLVLIRKQERKAQKLARLLASLDDTARLARPVPSRRRLVSLSTK